MTRMYPSRRTVLRTIGGGLAIGTMSIPVRAGGDTLAGELNAVRAATRRYRDVRTARDEGFTELTPYVPGMGFHFSRESPFGTSLMDPPVLVYFTNGSYNPTPGSDHDADHDDDLILGAVEFLEPGDQRNHLPNIFSDEDSNRRLKVSEAEGWHYHPPVGEMPDFTALHTWVHRGNPAGVFHNTNPKVD